MVFGNQVASAFPVVRSTEEQFTGGKKPNKKYCDKGDTLFVISNKGNVLIVFGKYGRFPILTNETVEIMIRTPEDLIREIKNVDLKMSYGFPIDFVLGIIENKPWKDEFIDKLKESNVRLTLKNEILQKYANS